MESRYTARVAHNESLNVILRHNHQHDLNMPSLIPDPFFFHLFPFPTLPIPSNRKPKRRIPHQHPLPTIRLPITLAEIKRHDGNRDHNQNIARHTRRESRNVSRPIFSSEDQGAGDSTNTADSSQRRRAVRTPPLAADVVRLVCHHGGDCGVCAGDGDEDADVLRQLLVTWRTESECGAYLAPGVLHETHDWQSDE